jgi:hypothetical protein
MANEATAWGGGTFKRDILIVTAIAVCGTVLLALARGQDSNWDQLNYHIYVVYAWLHHRLSLDVAPAQIQTWLNPIGYLPYYLAVRHLEPIVAGALIGACSAANIVLVYLLARILVRGVRPPLALTVIALCTAIGCTAPLFLSEVGTTLLDNLLSALLLGALVLVCSVPEEPSGANPRSVAVRFTLAATLVGIAAGLKLTNLVFAAAFAAALLVAWPRWRFHLSNLAWSALGMFAGFGLASGEWAVDLWDRFGNPVFPFYNAIFRSPWYPAVNFSDTRFVPSSAIDALSYPFQWLFAGRHPSAEIPFRDGRFALLLLLLGVALAVAAWRLLRGKAPASDAAPAPLSAHQLFVAAFFGIGFVIWLRLFGIQRYLVVLELLTGIMIWLLVSRLVRPVSTAVAVYAVLALALVVTTRAADWGHHRYGHDWFGVHAPRAVTRPDTLYVVLQGRPVGYLVPFLDDPDGPVVSLRNYLDNPLASDPRSPFWQLAMRRIAQHSGPIRLLAAREIGADDQRDLRRLGLRLDERDCTAIRTNTDLFSDCKLERLVLASSQK